MPRSHNDASLADCADWPSTHLTQKHLNETPDRKTPDQHKPVSAEGCDTPCDPSTSEGGESGVPVRSICPLKGVSTPVASPASGSCLTATPPEFPDPPAAYKQNTITPHTPSYRIIDHTSVVDADAEALPLRIFELERDPGRVTPSCS